MSSPRPSKPVLSRGNANGPIRCDSILHRILELAAAQVAHSLDRSTTRGEAPTQGAGSSIPGRKRVS